MALIFLPPYALIAVLLVALRPSSANSQPKHAGPSTESSSQPLGYSTQEGFHSPNLLLANNPILDTSASHHHSDKDEILEDQEMTRRVFSRLDSLQFPKPTGYFTMDGQLDTTARLLASDHSFKLFAAVRGGQLYVATTSLRSRGVDLFVFVALTPGELRAAPWRKRGLISSWSAFLSYNNANDSASWNDALSSPLKNICDQKAGAVLEGVIDFELLSGMSPDALYLAMGRYHKGAGGRLIGQAPSGNGNGNIEADEFHKLTLSGIN